MPRKPTSSLTWPARTKISSPSRRPTATGREIPTRPFGCVIWRKRVGWNVSREQIPHHPLKAGPERQWTEDAYVLATYLIDPSAIAYWSALHHWNMTEQFPRVTYVQSTARKFTRRKEVLGIRFRFVRVTSRKFFGLHRQHIDHRRYSVTDREKTILDCLDRLELAGGIAEVSKALRASSDSLDWKRVDEYLAH